MKLFNRETKFIACLCPKCGGNLEYNQDDEKAFCKDCGVECIAERFFLKRRKKKSKLEIIISFVERQQYMKRKYKLEERSKNGEMWNKNWWKFLIVFSMFIAVVLIIMHLET